MLTADEAPAVPLDFSTAREPASDAARAVIANAEARKKDVPGIKGLAVGKSDVYDVSPTDIHVKPGWNARDFSLAENQAHVVALAHAIVAAGEVQEPLTAYREDGVLYLSNGECRLRATFYAINVLDFPVLSVPVRLEPRDSDEASRIAGQLSRNSGKPLTPLEQAEVVRSLLALDWPVDKIATFAGKTPERIRQLIETAELPEPVRQQVEQGAISATEAVRVVREHGDEAPAIVERAVALSSANGGAKAGKATRATLNAAQANGKALDTEPDDAPDIGAELERAHDQIDELQAVIDSLNRTDADREIISLNAKFAQLNGRLQQEMTTCREAKQQADRYASLLKRIRAALGVDENGGILSAIETLKG